MQTIKRNGYKYLLIIWILLVVVIGCGKCEGGLYDSGASLRVEEMVLPSQVISASVDYMTTTSRQTTDYETTTIVEDETTTAEQETTTEKQEETTTKKPEPTTTKKKEETATKKKEEPTTVLQIDVNDYDAVRKVVKDIVDSITEPGMSEFEKALAIHDWITFNIEYDFTYSNYYVPETLRDRKGVCQGYALLFDMMAEFAGLECIFIGGVATNSSGQTGGHAWNQVKVDGIWYCVDTGWDDPASTKKKADDHSSNRYDYFLLSNETFDKNHSTEMEKKECPYDYDRSTVLKAAIASGVHKNARYADSKESAIEAINTAKNAGQKEVVLWYYDTTVTKSNMKAIINDIIANVSHSVKLSSTKSPKGGVTKYTLKLQ